MAFNYPVKWITNTMRGAPVMAGVVGARLAIFDALLVSGWGALPATSVTVADGVGTATFASGSFEPHAVVKISGATPALLNGEARVLSSTTNAITFETDAPNGPASGSIEVRYAPAGWERPHPTAGNVATYRSADPARLGGFLRLDDSHATLSRLRGYMSMSDLNNGSEMFPSASQFANGAGWPKSDVPNAAARAYVLAADSRALLEGTAHYSGTQIQTRFFGDGIPLNPAGDAFGCGLSNSEAVNSPFPSVFFRTTDSNDGVSFPRPSGGVGTATIARPYAFVGAANKSSGDDDSLGSFPSIVDGGIKISRIYASAGPSDKTPRVVIPGVFSIPQSGVRSYISPLDILTGGGPVAGRRLLAVDASTSGTGSAATGIGLIDITGPWR